ncbi:hypothetical protein B0H19DRAFT_1055676 [Mycena capillaripes]|nr:hypothetical protein B0H19DRAFT_1055676 [Mycena capillaripes]
MAILSKPTSSTYSRPTRVRPMRPLRLTKCTPLDRWLATADVMLNPGSSLYDPLPDNEVMCELFVCIIENIGLITIVQSFYGTVYRLSMVVHDARAGDTELLSLDRHQGFPTEINAPLWTQRLPPNKFLCFSQPRAFIAKLVAGMSDVQFNLTPSAKALSWARDATIGTSLHRGLSRHCKTTALRKINVWTRGKKLRGFPFIFLSSRAHFSLATRYDTELYGCSVVSFRKLRNQWGLKRTRQQKHTPDTIRNLVLEIKGKFPRRGILAVRKNLRQEFKVRASENVVKALLKEIEPEAVHQRKGKNSNARNSTLPTDGWAQDQHDKWGSRFGLWLHNGIDPFIDFNNWLRKTEKNNVKSEANWSVMRGDLAPGLEDLFQLGVDNGWYDVGVPLENLVFRWIAIPFVQIQLDLWVRHRNEMKPRKDKHKIPVSPKMLDSLEAQFAPPDHEVFQLTPPEFDHWANIYYNEMGKPVVTHKTFWVYLPLAFGPFKQGPDAEADLHIPLSSHIETMRRLDNEGIPLLANQQPLRRVAAAMHSDQRVGSQSNGLEMASSSAVAGPSSAGPSKKNFVYAAPEYACFTSSEDELD